MLTFLIKHDLKHIDDLTLLADIPNNVTAINHQHANMEALTVRYCLN